MGCEGSGSPGQGGVPNAVALAVKLPPRSEPKPIHEEREPPAALMRAALCAELAKASDEAARLGKERAALATERGVASDGIERALFADLADAHILREARLLAPEALLAEHHLAQHQAVLLRALSDFVEMLRADAGDIKVRDSGGWLVAAENGLEAGDFTEPLAERDDEVAARTWATRERWSSPTCRG